MKRLTKKQRFNDSWEAEKHAEENGCPVTPYRSGKKFGSWIDLPDGTHVHVKKGKFGPAQNMAVVIAFSCAGILAALMWFAPETVLKFLGG